jgi:ABC-type glycerol-3-phosphate transport system substrate-binding protein
MPAALPTPALPAYCAPGHGGALRAGTLPRRHLLALLGGAPLALGIGGACRGRDDRSASPPPLKPVTITAWLDSAAGGTPAFAPFHEQQVARFQQAHPTITVTVEPIGGTGASLQARVAAGDPPDLVRSNFIPMFAFAKQGALEPIDAFLDRRGKADFYDWARDGSTVDGKMYQWPWMLNPTGVVVNRSLFAQHNAAHLLPAQGPTADWTFDRWLAALRAVTVHTGDPEQDVYGTAFAAKTTTGDYYIMMYLWSNGAELYNREQTRVTLCSPEGIDGLQLLVDLVHRTRLAAPRPEEADTRDLRPLFHRTRLGILNGAPSDVADVEAGLQQGTIAPPFEALFLPVPHAPGKKAAAFVAINSFLVFRQPKEPDRTAAAMRLGFHLTDTPAQRAIRPLGQLPVRKSAGNIYPDDLNRTTAYAVIENARDMGRFPENGEIRTLFNQLVREVFTLQKGAKAALEEFCRLAEPIMAKSAGR